MIKTNYFQIVPGSHRPCDFDTEKLAYFYWLDAGKPEGRAVEFYYKAENFLIDLGNEDEIIPNYQKYSKFIFKLRDL